MPRLFTAIEIPPEHCHELSRLRSPLPGAKWIEPANMHVTLRFVGDIDNRTAHELACELDTLTADAFSIDIAGLGAFGGNDPKVLWAGISDNPLLETLARANERACRNAGLPPEPKTFKPHVTLARFKYARVEPIARYLERNARFRLPPFPVERFVLMSSRPGTGGGPYVVEEAYPLRQFGAPDWHGDDNFC